MRIFNRLLMALVFAALTVIGAFAAIYAFSLFGYRLSELPLSGRVSKTPFYAGLKSFVGTVTGGAMSSLEITILVVVAIVGLILLLAELKPSRPRHVRLGQRGTTTTRRAVRGEAIAAARQAPNVLWSSARVKARRRPGAKVRLKAGVRSGEDLSAARSELRDRVSGHLERKGIPLRKLKVKVVEAEGRQAGRRVR